MSDPNDDPNGSPSPAGDDAERDPRGPADAGGRDVPADPPPGAGDATADPVDDAPTVTCSRCDRTWDLSYELDELRVGNQAIEQFALDHQRHTGHFPDGVATWRAACRNCPETVDRLAESAARRWAETHARHTRHAVDLHAATGDATTRIDPPGREAGERPE